MLNRVRHWIDEFTFHPLSQGRLENNCFYYVAFMGNCKTGETTDRCVFMYILTSWGLTMGVRMFVCLKDTCKVVQQKIVIPGCFKTDYEGTNIPANWAVQKGNHI